MKALFYNDWKNDHIPEVIKETWIERIYEPYKKDGAVVLEIGANIGIFTLWAYQFASKVYAVEPSAGHFETLLAMLGYNKMLDKVVPLKYAVSNYDGKMKLYHTSNTTMFSLSDAVAPNKDDFEEVDTITIKSLMEKNKIEHIDLLNLDVEGEEMKILSDPGFDDIAKKIDVMVVEYHIWTNISQNLLAASIRDRGFKVSKIPTEASVIVGTRL